VDLGVVQGGARLPAAEAAVILLDTNALIWIDQNHRRARGLLASAEPLAISPASVLELMFLIELGRVRLRRGTVRQIVDDDRWVVDEAPSVDWFMRAGEESWTHDPFDRLIVSHARLRRWRLATGDAALLSRLRPSERVDL
jgi:PIN domain nuclease of toxin-antitoxin system